MRNKVHFGGMFYKGTEATLIFLQLIVFFSETSRKDEFRIQDYQISLALAKIFIGHYNEFCNKVLIIKALRELFHVGLAEAKDMADFMVDNQHLFISEEEQKKKEQNLEACTLGAILKQKLNEGRS